MALIHSLQRLKDHGDLHRFEIHDTTHGTVILRNGRRINVYMSSEYIIGETHIREAFISGWNPEYIIYNEWDKVTSAAENEARRHGAQLVKYGRFRYILKEMNG